ncbi:filamentous hemagglutinin [Herbaspirillum sp. Sphag1AN]|uniref:two-partner secretion domain-containing protein n=1 Tax=unclassified Herbaspirillum TaxID=2624150 RepID=UPI0016156593|nr:MULTISPECIES: hemagglutinin repeat-containing protein [unclassified Herbaspirillum]MBB3212347.1 filamentous hemagglutinin [Herbaspirillum sp. Sphag1AN]MBB3245555.1 filamentous hemagglutinin [Herbaspirillum sp. Sphag64]
MNTFLSRLAFYCSRAVLLLAAGLSTMPPALGQIVADPSAPKNQQPVIVPTANGLPQVNIQTPSAAGVSRNNYTQFDVQQQGAILNNARSNVQTQLGGWVQANPNLSNGTARVILNQVNSSNPSLLGGTVEVAGDRAQVIIANPSGITCDGCGFINANRATLTTGTPILNGGNLTGYQVNGGNVIVQGAGLNASQADYTDIIARAVQINAGIWSKELRVTTGINQVNADNTQATASSPAGQNPAPSFAVDVAQLGGMYANKIVLVGTEAGVGMRNAGTLGASGGDLILQSNGLLTNSGNLQASANVQISTQGDFSNSSSAKVYAGGNQSINVSGQLSNSGSLIAQGNNTISAASLNSSAGSTLAAGLQADGTAVASNLGSTDLSITTSGSLIANGSNLAAGNLSLSGTSTDISNSQTSAANITLVGSSGDVSTAGATVTSSGNLNVTANSSSTQTLNNNQGQLSAAQLNLNVANLNNQSGTLQQSGSGDTTLAVQSEDNLSSVKGSINNNNGTIATNGNKLSISANSLNNNGGKIAHSGTSSATGTASITVAQGIDNTSGNITSNAASTTLNAQSLTNTAGSINVTGSLGVTLDNSSGALSNQRGSVVANNDLSITAASVDNTQGKIATAQGNLTITSSGRTTNDSGTLQSALDMTLTNTGLSNTTAAQASQVAGSISARNLSINTGNQQLNNAGGTVLASQTLNLQTGALNNTGGLLQSGSNLTLNTHGAALTNSNAAAYVSSNARNASLNGQGGIVSQGQALLSTGNWFNNSGYVGSKGKLNAVVAALNNSNGQVQVNDQINLTIGSGIFENAGVLQAATSLTVTAPNISNTAGGQLSAAQTELNASGTLTNRGLIDGSTTRINAGNVTNIGSGRIYGDTLSIAATNLTNDTETVNGSTQAGVIAGRNRLDIGVTNLTNREHAVLYSAGDMAIGGSLDSNRQATGAATTVNNNSATIEAAGALNIASATINNTNEHLSYQVVVDKSYAVNDFVQGDGTVIPGNTVAFVLNYPSPGYSMGTGRLILASSGITAGQVKYYNTPDAISPGYCPGGDRDCDPPSVYYRSSDPIWSFFNVAPGGLDAAAALQDQINALQAKLQAAIVPFYVWRDYTETTHKAQVTSTDPGRIASGGAMTLNASTQLLNDNSNILAGGALNVTGTAVNNQALQVSVDTTRSGTSKDYAIVGKDCGGFFSGCSDVWQTRTMGYSAAIPATTTLSVAQSAGNTAFVGSSSGAATRSTSNSTRNGAILEYPAIANADGSTAIVRTSNQPIQLPNASLYQLNPSATANYLITTDPRFTNQKQWLSSSYMTQQLNVDPSLTQKRLGDGFYEQQLVSQQVAQLTGRRFLDNYTSDEAQYQALMDNGITFAKQANLQPGIALTAQQVAQLTSDIVWLVQQTVTLADGSTQTVLVPQVYVRAKAGDLDGSGSLLTGDSVNLQLTGDLSNSGQIAGRQVVQLNADNVSNLGNITGDSVAVTAQQDLTNQGGSITATSSLTASAGRDLTVASTVQSGTSSSAQLQAVDRVAGLYVTGSTGSLQASAGRDLTLTAANVSNAGSGTTALSAGRDLNLASVQTIDKVDGTRDAQNYLRYGTQSESGSQISGGGDVELSASHDLNARAATVQATGALSASAGNDLNITAGQSSQSIAQGYHAEGHGLLQSASVTSRTSQSSTQAIASSFGGSTVKLQAGQDVNVVGSNVVGDNDTSITAQRNLNIVAATETASQSSFREDKKSGLFTSGGIGITIGSQQQSQDQQTTSTSVAASTVGSTAGNINLKAGQIYQQTGSDVVAPGGDINIAAKTVNISAATESQHSEQEVKFQQSGLTLAISSPVISAIQTVQQMSQAASKTSDNRMKGLAAAAAALAVSNTYDTVQAGQGSTINGVDNQIATGGVNADGTAATRDATAADKVGGINVSASIGTSKSESHSVQDSTTARGSTVSAGGNLNISATGGGNASDLTIQGSSITAGLNAQLQADHDINLLAAQNTSSQHSDNKSISGSIGISYGTDGLLLNLSASGSKGRGDGSDLSNVNTTVNAGNQLTLRSGSDTTLKGAVASGQQVVVDVGTSGAGNLNIISLQDTNTYNSKQQSLGGSVSVGVGKASGSINYSQSTMNSDYASVMAQSGIKAGDGGFQVNVAGNTDLIGGVIASSDQAVVNNKNSLTTATLTQSDIQNSAHYDAQSVGVGFGYSGKGNAVGQNQQGQTEASGTQVPGSSLPTAGGAGGLTAGIPMVASASGSSSSSTRSGISGGAITITNAQQQAQLTGQTVEQTVAGINRDVSSTKDGSNALKPIFNQQEIEADFAIVNAVSREAGNFLMNRAKEADAAKAAAQQALIEENAKPEGQQDPERIRSLLDQYVSANEWSTGGDYRKYATAVIGAITGNVSATTVEFAQSAAVNYLQALGAEQVKSIADNLGSESARTALQGIVGCAGSAGRGTNCAAGALGASAGTIINNLLGAADGLTNEEKEARKNLVTNIVAGIATAAGSGSVSTATTSAQLETENNALGTNGGKQLMQGMRACSASSDPSCFATVKASAEKATANFNSKLKAACEGASASYSNCLQMMAAAQSAAMDVGWATVYAKTDEQKAYLQQKAIQQVTDVDAQLDNFQKLGASSSMLEQFTAQLSLVLDPQTLVAMAGSLKSGALKNAANIIKGRSGGDPDGQISNSEMLGANGPKVASKTIWKGDGKERIDVENPNPGQRPGQIHYQDNDGNKYLYDPNTNSFPDAPKYVNNLLDNSSFKSAIQKGLNKYLGGE